MFSVKKLNDKLESKVETVEGRILSLEAAPGHQARSHTMYCV